MKKAFNKLKSLLSKFTMMYLFIFHLSLIKFFEIIICLKKDIIPARKIRKSNKVCFFNPALGKPDSQVDFSESPETPEITEMTDNFTKVTKYLTNLKETLINYVWEKSHFKKQ